MKWITVNGKKVKLKRIVVNGQEVWTSNPTREIERRKKE